MTPLESSFRSLASRFRDRLQADAYETNGVLVLALLMARRDAPAGTGTEFMRELCALADRCGAELALWAVPVRSMPGWKQTESLVRLRKFYGKFGFTLRRTGPGNMRRSPKP